jgi:subtilisin-like proprotein convertase family protein
MSHMRRIAVASGMVAALAVAGASAAQERKSEPNVIGPGAAAQIQALLEAKTQRSPVEHKIGYQLWAGLQAQKGAVVKGVVGPLRSVVRPEADGTTVVEVRGIVGKPLVGLLRSQGAEVLYVSEREQVVRTRVPFAAIESIASSGLVRSVRPPSGYMLADAQPASQRPVKTETVATLRPGFERRAEKVRASLGALLAAGRGFIVSEGVAAHQVDQAEAIYGATGAGVKVGVLSDSVDYLAQVQAAGELPAVTVLQDTPGSGEGTAMLEIVHDMAPAAQLFFATAAISEQGFADNIRALRAAGCDIIVDDVFYFDESPFQDGPVAAAVADVTKSGAFYFSSAGNEGNLDDGTSGVWEGNFKKARVALPTTGPVYPGTSIQVHDFGIDNISNRMERQGYVTILFWNEPYGLAKADYDLFVLDSSLQNILDASLGFQNGNDFPIEAVLGPLPGERIVIVKDPKAATKRLHLNTFRGELALATSGQTHGHSAVAAAFSVAAVDAAVANGDAFVGGQTNPVEVFSSDGPRQVYFNSLGKPAPQLRKKPDVAAADGVRTATPQFDPFYGTSAAAPHAAGIAALLKSVMPGITPTQLRAALTGSALDIEAKGADRDSGAGIVMALGALQKATKPIAVPSFSDAAATAGTPDGDAYIEPGEGATLSVELVNAGGVTASKVSATLSTTTPGVTVTQPTSVYPNIPPRAGVANSTPFGFSLGAGAACGLTVDSQLAVTFTGGPGPKTFHFKVQTGQPALTDVGVSYPGASVPIPDDTLAGVNIPLAVAGVGRISDLTFSFDGSSCNTLATSTTNGLNHSWVGDLSVRLTSPQGTTVTLIDRPGQGAYGSGGNNFCQTVLDDQGGGPSIDTVTSAGAPYTGTFLPHEPLSAFDGEDASGTWTLNVADHVGGDIGGVNDFTLTITPFSCN